MKKLIGIFIGFALLAGCSEEYKSNTMDLSFYQWNVWPDREAEWEHDSLYLPPVDVSSLPVNPPSCGWDVLQRGIGELTRIPATVEEHFWGENGNPFGIAGDYVGVSWFTTRFTLPDSWEGKRIVLKFESVRLRAEVYLNRELAGYDLINGTPFEVDITDRVNYQLDNYLAVRITDPNGNFAWRDWETYSWGDYEIPPSHGFGGITGNVVLEARDPVYISNIFVKNKPDIYDIDVEAEFFSHRAQPVNGQVKYTIRDLPSGKEIYSDLLDFSAAGGASRMNATFHIADGKPWTPETPHLYEIQLEWTGEDGSVSKKAERFGLRWFEVRDTEGDRQFFLNGSRIVLRSAISWGHWPVNGIFPTPELAARQVKTAKELGLNMLNFHRGIGQTVVLDQADEQGLLYYEEPGGYSPDESQFTLAFKREKLLRMVKRDRNHPSLVIYSMINEANRDPRPSEEEDMITAHKVDPTRMITFTSTYFGRDFYNGHCPDTAAPFKMHMLPGDDSVHFFGLWDEHHAGGPGVYSDAFYNGPDRMRRHYDHPSELIFLGEEGAIGTLPRLDKIGKAIEKNGNPGWDGDQYLAERDAFESFLDEKGFRDAFPALDDLTRSIGGVAYYYQGRIIENFRIGNTGDGYVVNGWEGTKIENHSGIVDVYRNPKADPSILAYYNRPLYLAVKMRNKVVSVGDSLIADIYIVNETNLKGRYFLRVMIKDETRPIDEFGFNLDITGGNCYGELLQAGITCRTETFGYLTVEAQLYDGDRLITEGKERAYVVKYDPGEFSGNLAVLDTSGRMQEVLSIMDIGAYDDLGDRYREPAGTVLLVGGEVQPGLYNSTSRMNDPMLDWVSRGNMLVITDHADRWAEYLNLKEVVDYRGSKTMDRNWFGGNYFVKEHSLFEGLPVNQAFNWEYQSLAAYGNRYRFGMRLKGEECVAGCYADHNQEMYTAVGIIPMGKGTIILSALDLPSAIREQTPAGVVAKRVLLNYLMYDQSR